MSRTRVAFGAAALGVCALAVGLALLPTTRSAALTATTTTTTTPEVVPGNAWGWGGNVDIFNAVHLGNGNLSVANQSTPTPVSEPGGLPFTQIASGGQVVAALDTHGHAWAWGRPQLVGSGNPQLVSANVPVPVAMPSGVTFTQLSAGNTYVYALDHSGRIWVWGVTYGSTWIVGSHLENVDQGQVGAPALLPTPPGVSFRYVAAGRSFAMAIDTSGHVWGWGDDSQGELGNGQMNPTQYVTMQRLRAPAGETFTQVAPGSTFAALLDSHGRLWNTGQRYTTDDYQNTIYDVRATPVSGQPKGVHFTEVAASDSWSMALASDGVVYGWGNDTTYQLGGPPTLDMSRFGQGSLSQRPTPASMPRGVRFTEVAATESTGAALDSAGRAWTWGSNQTSSLGIGKDGNQVPYASKPVAVRMPQDAHFTSVWAGGIGTSTFFGLDVTNADLSTIATSLLTPSQAVHPLPTLAVDGALAAGGAILITFPAQLFNYTFQENYTDIKEWWDRRRATLRKLSGRSSSAPTDSPEFDVTRTLGSFLVVVLVGAFLGCLNDPTFGFSYSSMITYVAVLLAMIIGVSVPSAITWVYRRGRHGAVEAYLHALPAGLAIAAGCVVLSRLTSFQPGYLYGVIVGVQFARELAKQEKGHVVALTTLTMLVVGVAAWIAWAHVNTTAVEPGAGTGLVLLDDLLASVFVSALVGSVISLLPLRFLPGHDLKEWHRGAWTIVFGVCLFGLVQVMIRPHGTHPNHVPIVVTISLFILFGVGSVLFREYWDRKRRAERGEPNPSFGQFVRGLMPGTR
ncbi:MAG: RCC1 domain-containing protein [Acidimicrobiales bacterium]